MPPSTRSQKPLLLTELEFPKREGTLRSHQTDPSEIEIFIENVEQHSPSTKKTIRKEVYPKLVSPNKVKLYQRKGVSHCQTITPRKRQFRKLELTPEYRCWYYEQNATAISKPQQLVRSNPEATFLSPVATKNFVIEITPQSLSKAQKLEAQRDQIKVMSNVSAKNYAQQWVAPGYLSALAAKKVKWEWLHLVAYRLAAKVRCQYNGVEKDFEAQSAENLVLGTAAANGQMIIIEEFIKKLIEEKNLPSVTLTINVNLLKANNVHFYHASEKIEYTITWKNPHSPTGISERQYHFDPFSSIFPPKLYSKANRILEESRMAQIPPPPKVASSKRVKRKLDFRDEPTSKKAKLAPAVP